MKQKEELEKNTPKITFNLNAGPVFSDDVVKKATDQTIAH
jgi:hypothetical protein